MSSKRNITYKCPYCDKRFNKENLVIHVGDKHDDMIPQGYSAFRVVFDYVNKKPAGYNGKCIICGKESGWDEGKGKYNRLCSNPECKKKYIQSFEERMIRSKGVKRISSTAEGQAKMLANRKISGEYKFQDGGIKTYTGTYEKKTLEFMDKVMNIKSEDVTTPGPILEYMFEGKKHIYISDIYYAPYNLIIEVKDGGNNPNNRSMPEYRAKQIAKEKWIIKNTDFNYLRLTNNDFSQLLAAFMELKMEMSNDTPERVIRINEGNLNYIEESGTVISIYNKKKELKKLNQNLANKINSTNYPWYFLHIEALNNSGIGVVYGISSKVTLYGLDEDPGTDGSKKSSGLFSVANLGNGKLHKLYENEYKNYHINKSKDIDPALRKFTTYNRGAAKTKDIVLKEEYKYIEEISRSGIKSEFLEKGDSCYNLDKWPDQYNILFVTGISGSGKTTLGIDLAKEFNARRVELDYIAVYYLKKCKERNAYEKFRSKLQKECPEAVEFFDLNPPEKYGLREKWADTGDILTDFCNWFVTKFSNNGKSYIINGSYLYEIFDASFYYDKPLIIKDINLMKTVFRRTWREFIDKKDDKFFHRLESAYKALKTGLSKEYRKANKDFKSYRKDMNKNAELVEEGFLKSEPDILYNKEAFDNGDINICFITGHSGSGKSTLAHGQESKTVEVYELDDLQCIADRFTMANLKEYGDLIYTYFKGPGKQFYTTWDQLKEDMTPGKDYEDKLYPGFVAYAIDWAKKHKDKKFILEGVWLFCNDETGKPYFEPSYFKDYAFYIKGTSAVKSKWRAAKRDMKYDMKEESHNRLFWIKSFTKSFFFKNWKWYKFDEKRIQVFRDYFKDKPETVLSEAYSGELGKIQRDPEIIDSYGFISSNGIYNENVKIKGFNKWLRGRSELLILDGDKLYLKKDPKKGYSIPGGGWEKDEDHNLSAIRETNEEARIKVKNVNYVFSYVAYFPPKDWVKEKISKENWWYGEYIELYIGEYDGQYKGKVEKIDQDKAMESGKFYDIKSIYNDLIPVHQEALSDIINEASISNYKFLDIKSNKSKALEYLKANSETKSYAEDTIKNYNGELVIYNDIMIGRILVGDKKDKGFITDFSIDEEYRGNRLGSKLIDDAINKYHGVDLLVNKDNKLAIDMYKRRGFVIVKTYKNQYYMKLESKLKEDTYMMNEAMNALMTGFIPGSVDNPNNTYIVNYMQNNVFSGEDDPNEGIGISDNPKLTNLIIRDSNGILKKVDESFLDDKTYKVYIIELSKEEVSNRLSKYMGEPVEEGFVYETLIGHKLYTKDQIQFESCLQSVISYHEYMKAFKEICDNYFQAKDKTSVELSKNFIPKEVRFTNNSGLMSSKKVYNLNEYINAKSDTNILECLDITIKEGHDE